MIELENQHGIDLKSIAQSEKFVTYEIKDLKGGDKGLNFNTNTLQCIISGTKVDGTFGECEVFIKYSHKNHFNRLILKAEDCFLKECTFYKTIAPQLYKIQNEVEIDVIERFKIPRLIQSSNERYKEYIAMENIGVNNFRRFNHLTTLDYNHLRLMIKRIANFHGTVFAWKHKDRDSYDNSVCNVNYDAMNGLGKNPQIITFSIEGLKHIKNILTDEQHIMKVNGLIENFPVLLDHLTSAKAAEPYDILCHGDFWINNFWFIYNNDDKPTDVCFFDWQMIKCGSVFIDIFYMFFLCTNAEIRKKYFKDALSWYYSDLEKVLKKFNLGIENVYPKKVFIEHEKKFARFGLIAGLTCTVGMTADPNNLPDITKLLSGEERTVRNEIECTFSDLGKIRVKEILTDYISYGYD